VKSRPAGITRRCPALVGFRHVTHRRDRAHATQLTAVFTAVLGVGAIVTAILAGLAFRKQSQEFGLLLEQNKRDTDERRRAQAARVFMGAARGEVRLVNPYVRNASDSPSTTPPSCTPENSCHPRTSGR